MTAGIKTVAVYATNVGTHVRVGKYDTGAETLFTVTCDGCGTVEPARSAAYAADNDWDGNITRAMANAGHDANAHANTCRLLPEHMWPADGAR